MRLSIFLSVFNVHVNRSPIAGVIRDVRYQRGQYLNAMNQTSAELNEQNIVTVEGDGQTVVFKQIAGLLARRIVFYPKVGDHLERGQRVGLIKFGSRVDVLFAASAQVKVKVGDHVKGGASVLAYLSRKRRASWPLPEAPGQREGALMETIPPQTAAPAQQRDVHSPVAVYHRQHGDGLLRHPGDMRATASEYWHLDNAAKAIGFAVLFDGLDGRIARMTGTSSDFGKELDSLADAITPLAWLPPCWRGPGDFYLMPPVLLTDWHNNWHIKLTQLGAIASFLFLIAGVSRLARFNITSNPQPSNPGRPGKKYFVGMPIPAGAGVIAAVVHFPAAIPSSPGTRP
jgi:hypothetical protein